MPVVVRLAVFGARMIILFVIEVKVLSCSLSGRVGLPYQVDYIVEPIMVNIF